MVGYCTGRDAHCRVAAVNERYLETHRVVLWPQAVWAGRDPLVVCFDPDNLVARVNAVLKVHCASCLIKSGAAENVAVPGGSLGTRRCDADVRNRLVAATPLRKDDGRTQVPASEPLGADVDVTDLYADDYALWAQHCAPLDDGVGHDRWRRGRWG